MLILAQWPSWLVGLMVVGFVVISCLLMIIVLLQRPQGGGLSEAFGASGAGAGNTAFGARVGDALTMATIIIFIAFLGIAIALNYAVQPGGPVAATTVGGGPNGGSGGAPVNIDATPLDEVDPEGTTDGAAAGDPSATQGQPAIEGNVDLVPLPDLNFPAPDEPGGRGFRDPNQDQPNQDEGEQPVDPDGESESSEDDAAAGEEEDAGDDQPQEDDTQDPPGDERNR